MTVTPPQRHPGGKHLALTLGQVCRDARARLRLTQQEVAERVGIATEVYGRMERGNCLPSLPTFRRICVVLEVSADELLALSRSAPPAEGLPSPLEWKPPAEGVGLRRLVRLARELRPSQVRVLTVLAGAFLRRS